MFCSACGLVVDEDANFCKSCGRGMFLNLKSSYLHFFLVPNNDRHEKTLREIVVFQASRVLLLHDIPFQMQMATTDKPWTNSFSLFCCYFLFCLDSCGPPQFYRYKTKITIKSRVTEFYVC